MFHLPLWPSFVRRIRITHEPLSKTRLVVSKNAPAQCGAWSGHEFDKAGSEWGFSVIRRRLKNWTMRAYVDGRLPGCLVSIIFAAFRLRSL